MDRPFLTSLEDTKLLKCNRCNNIRPPTRFQPVKTHRNKVAGWRRSRHCIRCPTDDPPTQPIKTKPTYKELLARISNLETENASLHDSIKEIHETLHNITDIISKESIPSVRS